MISRNLPKKAYTCRLWDHYKKLQSLIILKLLHIENQKSPCETYKYPLNFITAENNRTWFIKSKIAILLNNLITSYLKPAQIKNYL